MHLLIILLLLFSFCYVINQKNDTIFNLIKYTLSFGVIIYIVLYLFNINLIGSLFSVAHASTNSDLLYEVKMLRNDINSLQTDLDTLNKTIKKICVLLNITFDSLNSYTNSVGILNDTISTLNYNLIEHHNLLNSVKSSLTVDYDSISSLNYNTDVKISSGIYTGLNLLTNKHNEPYYVHIGPTLNKFVKDLTTAGLQSVVLKPWYNHNNYVTLQEVDHLISKGGQTVKLLNGVAVNRDTLLVPKEVLLKYECQSSDITKENLVTDLNNAISFKSNNNLKKLCLDESQPMTWGDTLKACKQRFYDSNIIYPKSDIKGEIRKTFPGNHSLLYNSIKSKYIDHTLNGSLLPFNNLIIETIYDVTFISNLLILLCLFDNSSLVSSYVIFLMCCSFKFFIMVRKIICVINLIKFIYNKFYFFILDFYFPIRKSQTCVGKYTCRYFPVYVR
jgi:hypothetical protein